MLLPRNFDWEETDLRKAPKFFNLNHDIDFAVRSPSMPQSLQKPNFDPTSPAEIRYVLLGALPSGGIYNRLNQ